jgi:threonine aldolase
MMQKRGFASDNNSGVHPRVLKALSEVNTGHTVGYGNDRYTKHAVDLFKELFGDDTSVILCSTVLVPMCWQ